jgi:prepilin-type N-terminal cleavage/methylation domain-containing protein
MLIRETRKKEEGKIMKKQAIETMKSAKQAGFTLIELTAALAIAALAGAAAHGSGGGAGAFVRWVLGQ